MSSKTQTPVERDDALFDSMAEERKRRKRKLVRTVIISAAALLVVGFAAVSMMRKTVTERFASSSADVQSYAATVGTISTTISGSGMISSVDAETVSVPAGVEITEVLVEAGDRLSEGDVIATVSSSSVLSALSTLQTEVDELDSDITLSQNDRVSVYITNGVPGRLKRILASEGDSVIDCMTENGALAYVSIDGCMALEISSDTLKAGDGVTVTTGGREYEGRVESALAGTAIITLTDEGPQYDAEATVTGPDGRALGSGRLYIHSPLAITAYAGKIGYACAEIDSYLNAGSAVFVLEETATTAEYDSLVQSRHEKEADLSALMKLLSAGAVTADFSGTVASVEYSEDSASTATTQDIVTISPDREVSVTIGVDESNILSLKVGQSADVTVKSVGSDIIEGTVTNISKSATASSGVTQYSAEITFPKSDSMLSGMTASVDVRIEGVENAVIIPADALHRTSSSYYVYTSYDEATGEYGGMREVTPGVSNSNYVEIISGLSEGETVYYVEQQSFSMPMFGGNMGGGAPGSMGGGMPNGGGMRGSGSGGGMPGGMR